MPSSPSTRLRIEEQATGENLNTWGARLNTAIDLLEDAIAGVEPITISGAATTLTSTNYVADQARNAVLVLTGSLTANSTITAPSVEKLYLVVNNTTQGAYSLTLKTAAGTGYALRGGPQWVFCDGTDVYRGTPRLDQVPLPTGALDMNAQKLSNLAQGTANTDAVTKAQMETALANAAVPASPTAGAVKITLADTTAQFLDGAVNVTAPLAKTVQNPGADETLLFAVSSASETASGVAEIATQAEATAGTDDVRFLTPLKLKTPARRIALRHALAVR